MNDAEHRSQVALVTWAAYASGADPRLKMLHAIPNGGQRSKAVAGKLRAEGVKAGCPDLHLPIPVAPYAGLWIEMKAGKNTTTPEQDYWLETLAEYGHACVVCYGWEPARDAILRYLRGEWASSVVEVMR